MNTNRIVAVMLCAGLLAACQPQAGNPALMADDIWLDDGALPMDGQMLASCSGNEAQTEALISAVNARREINMKNLLEPNDKLNEIAQDHACDMARSGRLSVAGSDGSSIVDRARAVDFPTCGVIQMASAAGSPEALVNAWMGSTPHREQLLGDLSDEIGAGVTYGPDGQQWWSLVIGDDCRSTR